MKYGILILAVLLCGCASLFPNPDPSLQALSKQQLRADAGTRTYRPGAPHGTDSQAVGDLELTTKSMDVVNDSNSDWKDVEVWLNGKYVVFVPTWHKDVAQRLDFQMFYDHTGHAFDTHNGANPIEKLEICRDGTLYDVPLEQE